MEPDLIDSLTNSLSSILSAFIPKVVLSGCMACLFHIHLALIFAVLVVFDTLTRWLAITYQMQVEMKGPTDLLDLIKAMPQAHTERRIDSNKMRTGFFSKMILYLLLVLVALIVDRGFHMIGQHGVAFTLVISYLIMTELLSIIENLDDAGVSALHDLIDMVKGRRRR